MPARLRPTAPIAPDAILVGDPGRALMLAQELLDQPKMSNHARGLWGYGGVTEAGHELTIQSTGMGGPSASVVLADLAELGVRRAIRIGTCTALDGLGLGEMAIAARARPSRGSLRTPSNRKEPRDEEAAPDQSLTAGLELHLGGKARPSSVVSLDTLPRHESRGRREDGEVADMQTAALLAAGRKLEVSVAAILIVTHDLAGEDLSDERLDAVARHAGRAAANVLST